jgi:uncharacterized damage-inducible protein DinB
MRANVGDVTHAESLIQPTPAGNCLNWVLGHLVTVRSAFLSGFGAKGPWTDAESAPYQRHGPPLTDSAEAKPIDQIWSALDQTQQSMIEVIEKMTPEELAKKAPFSPTGNPNETIGSLMATIVFHDAYHAGQTGLLRRVIGKPAVDL